ncbi:MAG: RtcB family protein [Acidobacteria bacterium]|jgi:tRNA-splicing ligase RtcB|nr:RtcB family protein [Acidobacteriota bacterium]
MSNPRFEIFSEPGRKLVKAWTRGVQFDDKAKEQVLNVASMPFVHGWVAVMPDVHWGMGATVGSVIPTHRAIIPAAVGVDIGCGMMAVETSLTASDLPDNLAPMRSAIEAAVPHGRTASGGRGDRGAWAKVPDPVSAAWEGLRERFERIAEKHPTVRRANSVNHLGTLGTGNHFIEVCLDEEDRVWCMLHSGSRGVGNKIGSYFIELAKRDMRTWMINLPDVDLAYFPEGVSHFGDYVEAVGWAQDFARINREIMMRAVVGAIRALPGLPELSADREVVNCHHNYVAKESHFGKNVWLTRKGAVRAREGDLGIIPGSMGARSYIVRGKGNPQSYHSCSHGAGRAMSRTEARRRFTVEQHAAATRDVECRKDEDVIDETPAAYKPIDAVMEAQSDLVDVVHTLRQVVCVKG